MNLTAPVVTTADRNAKVLAALKKFKGPVSPTQIADEINEPWCMDGRYPKTAVISVICKRIGAVQPRRGVWTVPIEKK